MIFWIKDENDVIHLLNTLRDNPKIDTVHIIYGHIRDKKIINEKHINAMFNYFNKSHQKITLRFVHGILSPEGLQALAQEMHANTTVETLDLSCNNNHLLDDETGVMMASFLRKNTTLTFLDLSGNFFGAKAGAAFSSALMVNKTLKVLNLKGRTIDESLLSSKNQHSFAKMLTVNTALQSLFVDGHSITDKEDMLALAAAIKINKTLSHLGCSYCLPEVEDEDIENHANMFLLQAFKDNKSLRTLNFTCNFVNAGAVAEMLSGNSELRELWLEDDFVLSDLVTIYSVIEKRENPIHLNIHTVDASGEEEMQLRHTASWNAIVDAIEKTRLEKMQIISNERKLMREAFVQGIHPRLGAESSVSTFLSSPIFDPMALRSAFAMADMQDPFQSEFDLENDVDEISEEEEHKTLTELSYSLGYSQKEDDKYMQDVREELQKIDKKIQEDLDKQLQPSFTPSFSSASIVQMDAVASSSSSSAPSKSLKRKHED